jgi:hypothetical protein
VAIPLTEQITPLCDWFSHKDAPDMNLVRGAGINIITNLKAAATRQA